MSKIRNKLIATLTIFAMLFTSLSAVMFASNNFVKAEGEESTPVVESVFELQDGASSGYIDEEEKKFAGLRWETRINKAYYDSLTENGETLEFGTLIAPASYASSLDFDSLSYDEVEDEWYVEGTDMYVSNIVNANATSTLFDFGDDLSGEYIMRSAIRYEDFEDEGVNIKDGYATELVARAYVKILDAEGEVIDVKYSDADTVRSLRNSVAYNLAAGNFSEADAASLKKFAVDGDIIDCGEQYAFYNREENTAKITELAGATNVEFILNSKPTSASVDANGVVTFGKMDANDKVLYLSAFANGNLYYKKLTVAKAISTTNEYFETFSFDGDVNTDTAISDVAELNSFNGVYVLTNNIDFKGVGSMDSFTNELANNIAEGKYAEGYYDDGAKGKLAKTKGLAENAIFDGQGYTISNLNISNGGLFGAVSGTIKNVGYVNFTAQGNVVLAKRIFSSAKLENLYFSSPNCKARFINRISGPANSFDRVVVEINAGFFDISSASSVSTANKTNESNTSNGILSGNIIFISTSGLGVGQLDYRLYAAKVEYDPPILNGQPLYHATYFPNGYQSANTTVESYIICSSENVRRFSSRDLMSEKYIENLNGEHDNIDTYNGVSSFVVDGGQIYWATDYRVTVKDEAITTEGITIEYGDSVTVDVENYLGSNTANVVLVEDNSDAISIENNIIKAKNLGTSNVEIYVNGILVDVFKVTVTKNLIDKTNEKPILLDANGEEFIVPEGWIENKTTVSLNGALVEDCTVEVDGNDVSLKFPNEKDYANKEYVVTFETDTTIYKYKVKYVTAYIRTAEEFVSIFALAKDNLTTAESTEQLATFDGYYMLANNIDFTGKTMPTETYTFTGKTYYSNGVMNIGLTGTFDGDGYVIYNLSAPRGGIFGAISGTLKNVAFINCNINSTENVHTGFLANMIYSSSRINNIYVSLNDTYSVYKHIASTYMTHTAQFVGCYFEADLSFLLSPITTSNGYHAGAIENTNNATILVSRQMIGSRNEYGTANGIEGNSAGTTPNRPYYGDKYAPDGDLDGTGANQHPRKNRITGAFYRYEDREDLYNLYNGTDTKADNIRALFAKFDTNLFDVGAGRIAWKNDLTAYSILYNNNKVVDDIISVPSDGDKEITLSVKTGIDVVLENEDLTYVLDCKDGSVTLTGAVLTINKDGEATVTIKMGDEVIRVVTIDVYKPIIDRTSEAPIILDSFGEEIAGIDAVYSASVEGGEATVVDGNKVALSFENEVEAANKDYVVSIETETNTILYKAHYYTSYIKTPEEFVSTFSFGTDSTIEETISTVVGLPNFSGYYMLANNIDFAGKTMPADSYTYGSASTISGYATSGVQGNYGLTGIFDGDGYSISNLNVPLGGVFGVISGTVKNVAFVNIDFNSGTTTNALLARYIYASAELTNIYLQTSATYNANRSILAITYGSSLAINNCYFVGNMLLSKATTNDAVTTYNPTNSFTNEDNTAIFISEYMLGARAGAINQAAASSWHDGNATGSTPVELKNPGKSAANKGGNAAYRAKGAMYRYVSIEEMSSIYTDAKTVKNWTWYNEQIDTETGEITLVRGTTLRTINEEVTGLTTQQTALKNLLTGWNTTYFNVDMTNGTLTWKVKTAN